MSWTQAIPLIGDLLDRVIPDVNERKKAKEELAQLQVNGELEGLLGQLKINLAEAQNHSVFVSGWRPFVGWTCGIALAYNFVAYPLLKFGAVLFFDVDLSELPQLEASELMTVLLGMLGLGGMRSYEKRNGVARK